MTWHADELLLDGYAGGSLDPVRASSLEAHLLDCDACRVRLAPLAPPERLEQVWADILREMDAPQPGPIEVLLARLGLSDHLARLLAVTPSLSLSWLGAVALTLVFAVAASNQNSQWTLVFLLLAPLAPVAGVAAAYGPFIDPTYEIGLASPMSSFRLLLARSAAVLVTTIGLAGLAGLGLPGLEWTAAAWLLPGLALTLVSLALATWVSPLWAAGWVAFLWIGAVTVAERTAGSNLAAFRPPAQVLFLVLAILAALVLVARRGTFELRSER